MNLPVKIAIRYLFSKKSHSAINTISIVSVCGVAITTMALICTLSVYNGFQELISSLYSSLDPEIRIEPAKGKTFDLSTAQFDSIAGWDEVDIFAPTIEDNALILYRQQQMPIRLKGVTNEYAHLTQIDSILLDGEFKLADEVVNYATLGVGVANQIGAGARYTHPLTIYAPKRKAKVNLANPSTAFNQTQLFNTAVFSVNQPEYDDQMVIVPLSVTQQLFDYKSEVSAIEIALKKGHSTTQTIKKLEKVLGSNFVVKDRLKQQETSYRMMQIEKWMTFLILSFILMIASFNVIGSLSMLIIDKQPNIKTLFSLGADTQFVRQIFLFEGWLITAIGAGGGLIMGVILCLLQQEFGLLKLGSDASMFIIDAYPVRVDFLDILAVAFIVMLMGFFTSWFPINSLRIQQEKSE